MIYCFLAIGILLISGCDRGSIGIFKIKNSTKVEKIYYETDGNFGTKYGKIKISETVNIGEVVNSQRNGIGVKKLKIYSDLKRTKLIYSYSKLNGKNEYEEFDVEESGDILFEMTEDKIIKKDIKKE